MVWSNSSFLTESIADNQAEFPPLGSQSTNSLDRSSEALSDEKSWADIAEEVPKTQESVHKPDHRPNAWETAKGDTTYANVAEHQIRQEEEFPTPRQATEKLEKKGELEEAPKSQGVSDLLEQAHPHSHEDHTQPHNPDRSYASATENRDFPPLDDSAKDRDAPQSNELSDLPDINELLYEPSKCFIPTVCLISPLAEPCLFAGVHVPPPPPSQSFAKIAAKTPPTEEVELAATEAPKPATGPKESKPNFPPIDQAKDTNASVTDLSDLPSAHDMLQEKSGMFYL
jgi:hypothetical protein